MTTALASSNLTLKDHLARMDPNGAIDNIVETLSRMTPVVNDAVWKEGNLPDGHKFTSRESLPVVGKRRFYEGAVASKSTTAQVTETCANFSAQSVVDVQEAKLNGNEQAFRYSEDKAFMMSMGQGVDSSLIFDNHKTDQAAMTGLLPRLDATAGSAGKQIVKYGAGGSNTNASMLLVGWSDETVHAIFPRGSKAGIEQKDMGEQLIPDANGNRFRAYVTDWTWQAGLCVKDKRFIAAVRNIDMSTANPGTVAAPVDDIILAAIDAYYKIYAPEAVKLVWYVPRALRALLHKQAIHMLSHSALGFEDINGKRVLTLMGAPIHTCDAMTTTEGAIT